MNIHEYQAKDLLKRYGVPVPDGVLISTAKEAGEASQRYGVSVLKAQIHSGGRGKAGGVRLVHSAKEAEDVADQLLGMRLFTKQTGAEGKLVRRLLVTEAVDVEKEYYLSITDDNEHAGLVIVLSEEGGTEIEETASLHPEKIFQIPVSVIEGYKSYEGLRSAELLGMDADQSEDLQTLLRGMIRLYLEKDCSLIEINPLVLTKDNRLLCLDAKINIDDNALYRHPDILELRDPEEEDPKEYKASKYDLSYIALDGQIGCLVNGAGLAMATMDVIYSFGGKPANFLDVGGNATTTRVKAAFEILLSDPNVRSIFVNIFGGIMKCDVIAEGIVEAVKEMGIRIPLIVRLEGTNVEKGSKILSDSGMDIITASDMADGACKAVQAAQYPLMGKASNLETGGKEA